MLNKEAQIVLFSATFPNVVREFAGRIAPEANEIYLKQEDVTVDAIKQLWLQCDGEEGKFDALSILYELMTIGQSIVFCRVSLQHRFMVELTEIEKRYRRRDRRATSS